MEHIRKSNQRRQISNDIRSRANEEVVVNNLDDIMRIISEFDPTKSKSSDTIRLSSDIKATINNAPVVYNVSAETKSKSKREYLIEGLDIIKNRVTIDNKNSAEPIIINNREVLPPKLGDSVNCYSWVDPIIKRWTGGFREGLRICWTLSDGYIYKYDIYTHKLTRAKDENRAATVS